MKSLLPSNPPDNTGSETLERYRYQAQISVRFCLECLTGNNVSVFLEHFEDIVVEYSDKWIFIQVKTKEPHLQPWNFSAAHSGLQSLYRTYKNISGVNAEYHLYLEGGIKRDDLLNELVLPTKEELSQKLISEVAKLLKISEKDCEDFLTAVTVFPNQPSKDLMVQANISMIGEVSPKVPVGEIIGIEKKLTDEILNAMAATRLKNKLFQHVCGTKQLDIKKEVVKQKQFNRQKLKEIVGTSVNGNYPLLRRYLDTAQGVPSDLERKMIRGGAKEAIINRAKNLRANSTIRLIEARASALYDISDEIEDLDFRQEQWAEAIIAKLEDNSSPANLIWAAMTEKLMDSKDLRDNLDPSHIFIGDPMLILGYLCELSDRCRFAWGEENA